MYVILIYRYINLISIFYENIKQVLWFHIKFKFIDIFDIKEYQRFRLFLFFNIQNIT